MKKMINGKKAVLAAACAGAIAVTALPVTALAAISQEEALQIAYGNAGTDGSGASLLKNKADYDDGRLEYEIEFVVDGVEYEFTIDASTGMITDRDTEYRKGAGRNSGQTTGGTQTANNTQPVNNNTQTQGGTQTQGNTAAQAAGQDQALAAALADAGIQGADIGYSRVKQDYDDGRLVWEVEFYVGNKEYDYTIDAATGRIIEKDFDIEDDFYGGNTVQPGSNVQPGAATEPQVPVPTASVSREQAYSAALADAGINASDVSYYKIKQDYENGRLVWEVEFYVGAMEYDYTIDANGGQIFEKDFDIEDDYYYAANSAQAVRDVRYQDWYFDDVRYMYENNYMNGVGETAFGADEMLSRGMLVTILYRMAGSPAVSGTTAFTDLTQDYYRNAVIWASTNGIVTGMSDTVFAPDSTVTREQAATIFARYAEYLGKAQAGADTLSAQYDDAGQVSSWARAGMSWANNAQIIGGTGERRLSPQNGTKRSEAAAMLHRFDSYILR